MLEIIKVEGLTILAGLCRYHRHYMKLPVLDLLMNRLHSNVTRTPNYAVVTPNAPRCPFSAVCDIYTGCCIVQGELNKFIIMKLVLLCSFIIPLKIKINLNYVKGKVVPLQALSGLQGG
jgi:hypothetical protein